MVDSGCDGEDGRVGVDFDKGNEGTLSEPTLLLPLPLMYEGEGKNETLVVDWVLYVLDATLTFEDDSIRGPGMYEGRTPSAFWLAFFLRGGDVGSAVAFWPFTTSVGLVSGAGFVAAALDVMSSSSSLSLS